MTCGITIDVDIHTLWIEVAVAPIKQQELGTINQLLMTGVMLCRKKFIRSSMYIYWCITLWREIGLSTLGKSRLLSRVVVGIQCGPHCREKGWAWIVVMDVDMATMHGRNTLSNQIGRAFKVHFHAIIGANNLQNKLGTKVYLPHSLFAATRPLVSAFKS